MTIVDMPQAPSRMRKAIIRMVNASALVPQFSVGVSVDSALLSAKKNRLTAEGVAVSISDLIHHAVALSLREHPTVNSSFTEAGAITHSRVNVGFIVEMGGGMTVPVIHDADLLDPAGLAHARRGLTAAALGGTITPAQTMDATFTVSNLGTTGVHSFTAMVLPPQAAVLAVGSPDSGGAMSLTLSCDHRVLDGAPAARFLMRVGGLLGEELP